MKISIPILFLCLLWFNSFEQGKQPYYTEAHPSQIWTVHMGGYTTSFAHKDGDYIYVGSEGCKVVCIQQVSGEKIWEYYTHPEKSKTRENAVIHRITGDETTVYFNDCGSTIYAVDKKTGLEKWKYRYTPTKNTEDSFFNAFDDDLLTQGFVYENTFIINTKITIIAVDKKTGKLIWEHQGTNAIQNMSIGNQKIYYTTFEGDLNGIDPANGQSFLKLNTNIKDSRSLQLVVMNNKAYMTSGNPKRDTTMELSCFDLNDKKIKWTQKEPTCFLHSDGQALYTTSDEALTALDLETGKKKWSVAGSYSWYTSPVFYNNLLYIHNRRDRKIYGFDILTGEKKKNIVLNDKTYTVPIFSGNKMYFGEAQEYKCALVE